MPLPPPPTEPLAASPPRRAGSVRRTSSLDVWWPDGPGTSMRMVGRARDVITEAEGTIHVLAADELHATVGLSRAIEAIDADPPRPGIEALAGARARGGLRAAIDAAVPDDRRRHTPLALLLDDLAGTSLVAGVVWSRQPSAVMTAHREAVARAGNGFDHAAAEGICSGFRPGSSAFLPPGIVTSGTQNLVPVAPLADPDDPDGWHDLLPLADIGMRRARRMDVWHDDRRYVIDAHFRDSCRDSGRGEVAVHEYSLAATVEGEGLTITALAATPRVLPYPECPGAAPNVTWLIGERLPDLRTKVLERLRGVDCCTHLNDALRALADVAALLPSVE